MLIEFSVSNFRSINEKQTLSLVANADQRLADSHCIPTSINAIPSLLRLASIYGPNASGKSSLIMAFAVMRQIVVDSAVKTTEGALLNSVPFRFHEKTKMDASEFEIHFIENNIRYQYGFVFTKERIVREWLLAYVGVKSQRWFEREYDAKQEKYIWYFGSYFTGGSQKKVWENATRANALFLSTAVNLNCEQLRPVFYWFANKLSIINSYMPLNLAATLEAIKNEEYKLLVLRFLQAADLGITDIKVEMRKGIQHEIKLEADSMRQIGTSKEVEVPIVTLYHGTVGFDLRDESQGTIRLLIYAGFFIDVLRRGKLLLIDELEASLHSVLSRFLIGLFHNKKTNLQNAQLIFSTHDTSLLDQDLLRRDQIWFMEKDKNHASRLYPLTDFSPRPTEALGKGYLQGRYGALPFSGDLKFDQ